MRSTHRLRRLEEDLLPRPAGPAPTEAQLKAAIERLEVGAKYGDSFACDALARIKELFATARQRQSAGKKGKR